MLLSQVMTPFTYAVSGEEVPVAEAVVEQVISEPEVSESDVSELEVVEPEVIPEVDNSTGDNNFEVVEPSTWEVADVADPVVDTGTTILTWEETKNLEEESLTWTEASSWFIEKITESIKDFLWINWEEDSFESHEIYGTWEYGWVKVEVYAKTWLFASGTELIIEPVVEEKLQVVQEALLSWEVDFVEEQVIAFDITFRDPETQEELQPKDWTVQVTFNYEENESLLQAEENEEQEVKIYHLNDIDEEGNKVEKLTWTVVEEVEVNEEESEEGIMVVEAENFSVYTIVVQVREEQLINFQYWMISIAKPWDSSQWITIMDRNLWAISNDINSIDSYWYYYQWWNNYGFSYLAQITAVTQWYTWNNVYNNSWYYGMNFVNWSNHNFDVWSDNSHHDWLWWWENDMASNNLWWFNLKNYSDRQWPCPSGWHVPSAWEWWELIKYWRNTYAKTVELKGSNNLYSLDTNITVRESFMNYFKIPFAGERSYYNANPSDQDNNARLWSSSPSSSSSSYARFFKLSSTNISIYDNYTSRSAGVPVRCFKDFYEGTWTLFFISLDYKWWKWSTASINVKDWWTWYIPRTPERNNSIFSWWYLSGTDIEFNFTGTEIHENKYLYAKWNCKEWYENKWNKCVKSPNWKNATLFYWSKFNSTIKTLAKKSTVYDALTQDTLITQIKEASEIPTWVTTGIISDSNSDYPIYAWYDDWTIYYYTVAWTIYLNANSSYMFYNFKSLTNLDLSNWNTSKVTNMNSMFYGCSKLTSLDLSSFDTSNVTDMYQMFWSNSSLTSLDLSNFDTSNVTNMSSMFYNCGSLTSLNLSNFNTSSVTDMSSMFYSCSSLTSLDLSSFNTSKVTTMSSMFRWCSSLTSLNLSNFNTSSVTDMSNMFYSCSKLTSLDLSNFNTSSVTDMSNMFYSCSKLTSLDLSNFNTSKVTNMNYMFYSCSSLMSLDLSNFDTSNVTNMGGMFYSCSSLTSLNLSSFNTSKVTTMSSMFYNCGSLTSLNLSSFNTSKVTTMSSMFYNCGSLTSLDLSSFNTSNVTYMSSMFSYCGSLTSLDLSSFVTSNVTDMSSMFRWCVDLASLDLSNFNTSKVTNMSYMFNSCKSLTSLDLSNFNTSSVTNMSNMFSYFSSLENLNLSSFNTSNVINMSNMFNTCSSLTSLDLSSFDTSNVTNMSYMFSYCYKLNTIYVSNNFNIGKVSNSNYMFYSDNLLVWWNWTKYNASKVDKSYAIIDWKNNNPWYLTDMSEFYVKFYVDWNVYLRETLASWGKVQNPWDIEKTGYSFLWWYNWLKKFDFNKKIYQYTEIDALFDKNDDGNLTTIFVQWKMFNEIIKRLSNPWLELDYLYSDQRINGIKKSSSIPNWVTYEIVSTLDSETPLYVWYDNWIIHYYTKAKKIYLNEDSSLMFADLNSLVDNEMLWVDTSNVTNMYRMFYNCSSLTGLDLRNFDTSNVTSMSQMFAWSSGLIELNLSYWNVSKALWTMSQMFAWCNSLKELILDSWDLSKKTGTSSMFSWCPIKKVSMKWWKLPKDFSYGMYNLLDNAPSIEEIDVSYWDLSETENVSDLFTYKWLKKIIWINTWVWTDVKLKNMRYMFEYMPNLEEVDMSNMNLSGVTDIYEMFYNCSSLKKINMSNIIFNALENIEYLCRDCKNLEEVDLSNWNINIFNNNSYSTDSLFMNAYRLKKVNLSNFWKVQSTADWFKNNYSLTWLNLSWLDTSSTTNMWNMFGWASWLIILDLTPLDTSSATNMSRIFMDANNLKTIYVSEKFNTGYVTSSYNMFWWAVSLVWWNGTKYDPNNIDVTYARIDNEYQSWYFTDPSHFAVRYLTVTWEELLKQWISTGTIVEELEDSHKNYRYYTSWDLQTWFDFTEPLYWYTEVYVTWDDVKHVTYEYWTWVEEWAISSWSCLIPRDNNWVAQSESCEEALPELNVLTWYHTPLWYKKWEDFTYSGANITLTWDIILEAKAIANTYTVVYQPWEWTWEMESQEFEYDKAESLNKNKYRKEWYHFSWWIDMLWKEYRDWEKVLNLLTEWVLELTAQWLQNPPAAWWWQSITPATKEQEHNAAEEKPEDKQESNQDKQQDETVKDESKTPENTNTSNQTNTQESSSTSPDNSYKTVVDPEIQSAYEWAYERDVTTIPSLDDAMPDGVVKRGHLAKMVVNYATNVLWREIPEKIPSYCRWNDRRTDRESEEIKDYAVKSCALWLMWLDMPKFLPNMEVTRAQFGTIMSRLLWWKKYAWWTPYYRKHLNALKENNIMTQIENPEKRLELRQWVWLMLMRSAENK